MNGKKINENKNNENIDNNEYDKDKLDKYSLLILFIEKESVINYYHIKLFQMKLILVY